MAILNLPGSIKRLTGEHLDADYVKDTIAQRDAFGNTGLAFEGCQIYVKNKGNGEPGLYVVKSLNPTSWSRDILEGGGGVPDAPQDGNAKGLKDGAWVNVAEKPTVDGHINNSDIHVTAAKKAEWDGKAETQDLVDHESDSNIHVSGSDRADWDGAKSDVDTHIADASQHVSPQNRIDWDEAHDKATDNESEIGNHVGNSDIHVTAQKKADWDQAKADVDSHIVNGDIHVTAAKKAEWDAKADQADFSAHENNANIHVTAAQKAEYDQTKQDLQDHEDDDSLHFEPGEKTALDSAANSAALWDEQRGFLEFSTTGIVDGGSISKNGADIDVSAGDGKIVYIDGSVSKGYRTIDVAWGLTSFTPSTSVNGSFHLYVDSSGTVISKTTRSQQDLRQLIYLGKYTIESGSLGRVIPEPRVFGQGSDVAVSFADISKKVSGVSISAASSLTIQSSEATIIAPFCNYASNKLNPHKKTVASQNPLSFGYVRVGNSFESETSNVDHSKKEDSLGNVSSVTAGEWTLQRVILTTDGSYFLLRGQQSYSDDTFSVDDDEASHVYPEAIAQSGMLVGYIKVKSGSTDLTDSADASFIKIGSGSSVGTGVTVNPTELNDLSDVSLGSAEDGDSIVKSGSVYVAAKRVPEAAEDGNGKVRKDGAWEDAAIQSDAPATGVWGRREGEWVAITNDLDENPAVSYLDLNNSVWESKTEDTLLIDAFSNFFNLPISASASDVIRVIVHPNNQSAGTETAVLMAVYNVTQGGPINLFYRTGTSIANAISNGWTKFIEDSPDNNTPYIRRGRAWEELSEDILNVDAHISNDDIHVTASDKLNWNAKADQSSLNAHVNNSDIHVTASQKVNWEAARALINAHDANADIHVTATQKSNWDGAVAKSNQNESSLNGHIADNTIHIDQDDRDKIDSIPDEFASVIKTNNRPFSASLDFGEYSIVHHSAGNTLSGNAAITSITEFQGTKLLIVEHGGNTLSINSDNGSGEEVVLDEDFEDKDGFFYISITNVGLSGSPKYVVKNISKDQVQSIGSGVTDTVIKIDSDQLNGMSAGYDNGISLISAPSPGKWKRVIGGLVEFKNGALDYSAGELKIGFSDQQTISWFDINAGQSFFRNVLDGRSDGELKLFAINTPSGGSGTMNIHLESWDDVDKVTDNEPDVPPVVTSIVVESANPTDFVVTFDRNVNITDDSGWLFYVDGVQYNVSSVSGSGTNTLTFTVSTDIEEGESLEWEYDSPSGNTISASDSTPLETVSRTSDDITNNVTSQPTVDSVSRVSMGTTSPLPAGWMTHIAGDTTPTNINDINGDPTGMSIYYTGVPWQGDQYITFGSIGGDAPDSVYYQAWVGFDTIPGSIRISGIPAGKKLRFKMVNYYPGQGGGTNVIINYGTALLLQDARNVDHASNVSWNVFDNSGDGYEPDQNGEIEITLGSPVDGWYVMNGIEIELITPQ
jgi:hypothetical protein